VAKALTYKEGMKLEPWFQEEHSMHKMELNFKELKAPNMKEGMNVESTKDSFSPSKAQWNSLVC
jgi:hypothetical protein